MKYTHTEEYEITGCGNCPFAKSHSGHGECWTYCSHKANGRKPYEDILWGCFEKPKPTPDWCPIFKVKD